MRKFLMLVFIGMLVSIFANGNGEVPETLSTSNVEEVDENDTIEEQREVSKERSYTHERFISMTGRFDNGITVKKGVYLSVVSDDLSIGGEVFVAEAIHENLGDVVLIFKDYSNDYYIKSNRLDLLLKDNIKNYDPYLYRPK